MSNYPAHLDPTEARIIGAMITEALKDGGKLAVHDGEEWAIETPTRDRAAIEAEIAATCDTTLVVFDKDGERQGSIWMVHGNGEDVFSDARAPADQLEAFCARFDAVVNKAIEADANPNSKENAR